MAVVFSSEILRSDKIGPLAMCLTTGRFRKSYLTSAVYFIYIESRFPAFDIRSWGAEVIKVSCWVAQKSKRVGRVQVIQDREVWP